MIVLQWEWGLTPPTLFGVRQVHNGGWGPATLPDLLIRTGAPSRTLR